MTAPAELAPPDAGVRGPAREAGPPARTRRRPAGARRLAGFALPAVLLAAWQAASVSGWANPVLLPPPTTVFSTLWQAATDGTLLEHLWASGFRWVTGFLTGGALGVLLGSLTGLSRRAETLLDTTVQMLRTVPFMGLTPLLILWLGLNEAPKITLIALGSFFPLYLNTFAGIRNVDRKLIEVGKVFELNDAALLRRVIIPAALPEVLTGVRYALGVAWLALVIAELMGATSGLGFWLAQGREFVRVDIVLASLLVFSVAGKVVDVIVRQLEHHLLSWRDAYSGR
ncbi:ABC transporter permease [Georgenia sp. EYE_87]|uniref:ABC transporter permease n=1 Tax=Georgenia sp. EYE_87 TaxID=2853448 RepID=UPI0020068635|nr:ABC transporter permease [Georgenia sp. EYE_87]MCK6210275.1 ABC transporter permease [Georgenia sp. EYE_87]